jgi:3-oxoacyl-(acyl-carrier-protein) synthase
MQAEILDYRHTTEWDLEKFLLDESFKQNIQEKFPLVFSSVSSLHADSVEKSWKDFTTGRKWSRPNTLLDAFPGGFSRRVGEYLNLTGMSYIMNASCASALYALNQASMISLSYNTPVVVVCADNLQHPYELWRFKSLGALDNDSGRPFDSSSKGFKMGTGICMYLVKHPDVKFNMPSKATITNFAFYTNHEFTNPGTSDNIINNISGIDYSNIDFYNAHATGTPVGDIIEYEYFSKTIKGDVPIVSYKGHIGHCVCAAGGMEIALALDGKRDNILLANNIIGDRIIDDDRIITQNMSFPYKHMLKASFGFGGKNIIAKIDLY